MALSDTTVGVLIGAGATLGGSLVTGLLAFMVDSRRRWWEDRRRWDDARREAYVEYLHASQQRVRALETVVRFRLRELDVAEESKAAGVAELPDDPQPEALADEVKRVAEHEEAKGERLEQATAAIHLLASGSVLTAVDADQEAMAELNRLARLARLGSSPGALRNMFAEASQRCRKTRETFRSEAGKELRVELLTRRHGEFRMPRWIDEL